MSAKNRVRVKSMLPKTAENFIKMKKGLYLHTRKGYSFDIREEGLAKSLHILQAYGEIVPNISSMKK